MGNTTWLSRYPAKNQDGFRCSTHLSFTLLFRTLVQGNSITNKGKCKTGLEICTVDRGPPKPGTRFRIILDDAVLHASFEPYKLPTLIISEIHYNPSAQVQGEDEDFEFMELFNGGNEQVDLSGCTFTDGISFTFPEGSYIDPGEFILLASNPLKYENSNAQCFEISNSRLNNAGEILTLSDPSGHIIDQVYYDDHYPWPREPDGDGPSLELISPFLDNALASSWQASTQAGGSPGIGNTAC